MDDIVILLIEFVAYSRVVSVYQVAAHGRKTQAHGVSQLHAETNVASVILIKGHNAIHSFTLELENTVQGVIFILVIGCLEIERVRRQPRSQAVGPASERLPPVIKESGE